MLPISIKTAALFCALSLSLSLCPVVNMSYRGYDAVICCHRRRHVVSDFKMTLNKLFSRPHGVYPRKAKMSALKHAGKRR